MTHTFTSAAHPSIPSVPCVPTEARASFQAKAALVLGLVAVVLFQILGPVAWILGHQERRDIAAGRAPAAGLGLATAGMILGITGTCMLAFVALLVIAIVIVALVAIAVGVSVAAL